MHYLAKIRIGIFRSLCKLSFFAGLVCLSLASSAVADLLMEDTFDYSPGPIDGTQNGGIGWGGSWTALLNGGVTGANDVLDGSLLFSNYPTVGNRVRMANLDSSNTASPDRQYTRTERTADITKNNGDLWAAFLYQRIHEEGGQSGESTDQWVELRNNANFAIGMSASPGNSFGYEGSGQGIAVRYDNQPGLPDDSASAQDGNVYLMIGRWTDIEVVGGGTATMWALSASDYNTITTDGSISVAELDANHYLRAEDTTLFTPQAINPGNSMRWVNGVRFAALAADFDTDGDVDGADFLTWQRGQGTPGASLEDGDADGNGTVDAVDLGIWKGELGGLAYGASVIDYDELRYGDTLGDVVLLPSPALLVATVPEPSSLLLVGLAMIMLGGGVRKMGLPSSVTLA